MDRRLMVGALPLPLPMSSALFHGLSGFEVQHFSSRGPAD
jgi:hypothetical protein